DAAPGGPPVSGGRYRKPSRFQEQVRRTKRSAEGRASGTGQSRAGQQRLSTSPASILEFPRRFRARDWRRSMKRILAVFPVVLLAACHHEAPKLEKSITPVRVTAVNVYQPKSGGRYSATLMPGRQVSLAFRVSGIVTGLHRIGSRAL